MLEMQIVAVFALLPILFGILQTALLSSAYHVLAFATAEAARAGSVEHAQTSAMTSALASGLVGLHANLSESTSRESVAAEWVAARLRSEVAVREFARIERLAPSGAHFSDFARERDGRRGIPNDSLEYRDRTPGSGSGESIQEANWLRIRVRYCHELVVPLVAAWLPALLRRWDADPDHQLCYAVGRVPLTVIGSSPMQSEAWP
jgi:hypothetical protein